MTGIHLRWDNWASVRYAEELNSARIQSPFREPTNMGFWDKSLQIVKCLCDHGTQSVRRLAQKTGLSNQWC